MAPMSVMRSPGFQPNLCAVLIPTTQAVRSAMNFCSCCGSILASDMTLKTSAASQANWGKKFFSSR